MSSVEQSKLIRLLQELEDVGPELFSVLNNPPFPENPFNRRLAYHRDFTFKVNDTFRFPTGSRNTKVNYIMYLFGIQSELINNLFKLQLFSVEGNRLKVGCTN